ncbi:MAG: hypothetical protein OEY41_05595 [Acidimicrobiia bacterium]|nr:hypothetical protein [Acidimicrobiia bacterium]MDH5289453.1 hypothetical protein [Acidimicrobiia bacterium]
MLDHKSLAGVRRAMAEVADRQRDLVAAEANLQQAIRVLHATGGSLQEIADVVGLSRQRIHQIVKESGGVPGRRRRRTAGVMTCSFCDRTQAEVAKLIAGPEVRICDGCVADVGGRLTPVDAARRCSFCGQAGDQVDAMADRHGAAPWVCRECLDLCREIIAEELDTPHRDGSGRRSVDPVVPPQEGAWATRNRRENGRVTTPDGSGG